MVIASTCGNSPGHEFDPSFSPKSFFALILYENEHSVIMSITPYNASNHNEIKYRTTPFIVFIHLAYISLYALLGDCA